MKTLNLSVNDVSDGNETDLRAKLINKALDYIAGSEDAHTIEIHIAKRAPLDDKTFIVPGSIECGIDIKKIDKDGKVLRQIYLCALQMEKHGDVSYHS